MYIQPYIYTYNTRTLCTRTHSHTNTHTNTHTEKERDRHTRTHTAPYFPSRICGEKEIRESLAYINSPFQISCSSPRYVSVCLPVPVCVCVCLCVCTCVAKKRVCTQDTQIHTHVYLKSIFTHAPCTCSSLYVFVCIHMCVHACHGSPLSFSL